MLKETSIEKISDEDKEKYEAAFKDIKEMAIEKLTKQLDSASESGFLKDEISNLIDEVKKEEFQEKVIQMWDVQKQTVESDNYEKLADGLISRAKNNIGLI